MDYKKFCQEFRTESNYADFEDIGYFTNTESATMNDDINFVHGWCFVHLVMDGDLERAYNYAMECGDPSKA